MNNYNKNEALYGSLSWYDNPHTRHALDEFWFSVVQFLRQRGIDNICTDLQRDVGLEALWGSPQLIIGQCCGPDLFTPAGSELNVIARPVFSDLDCRPGNYFSYIMCRTNSVPRAARVAVNSPSSRSGCYALTEWMEANEVNTTSFTVSGSHKNSLALLESHQADLIAVDAHSLHQCQLQNDSPVIDRSREALAPPFVSHNASDHHRELLFEALLHAIRVHGHAVGMSGLIECGRCDYRRAGMDQPSSVPVTPLAN